jgi:hypothetical protein
MWGLVIVAGFSQGPGDQSSPVTSFPHGHKLHLAAAQREITFNFYFGLLKLSSNHNDETRRTNIGLNWSHSELFLSKIQRYPSTQSVALKLENL